jgi:hypothetical protein
MNAPTPFKISTITATGIIDAHVNLDALFRGVSVADHGIVYAELGSRKTESVFKGHAKKLTIARRSRASSVAEGGGGHHKRFDNQITLIFRYPKPCKDDAQRVVSVNVKVFRNGHIQMTGLRECEQGKEVIAMVMDKLMELDGQGEAILAPLPRDEEGDEEGEEEEEEMRVHRLTMKEYKVRLINCDFRVGFEIRRDQLLKCVCQRYKMACSFEPCIYPGCKIQYWYNTMYPERAGVCKCVSRCNGKGSGHGDGACKKITIAVFQSGCVIITGGQSDEQVRKTYEFVVSLLVTHMEEIRKRPLALPPPMPTPMPTPCCRA